MTSSMLESLVESLAVLSAFMLLGVFLRAKVPLFQKLLLPASVIGGTIALLLGPRVWSSHAPLAFPEEWISMWSMLPGVLIVPILASVPLGDGMDEESNGGIKKNVLKETLPKGLIILGILWICQCGQAAVGLLVNLIGTKLFHANFFNAFGWEISFGFCGGHGMAGVVGNVLQSFGDNNWEAAQGLTTAYATIGLVGGMLMGIIMINRSSRKGETMMLTKPENIPVEVSRGYTHNVDEQKSIGRAATHNSSIECITFHLSIIGIVWALSYWVFNFALEHNIPFLKDMIPCIYGLMIMYVVNYLIKKLKLTWLIDKKVRSSITGTLSDFAIITAVASMDIKAVINYMIPVAIISLAGFLFTYLACFTLCKMFFGKKDYFFERAIALWGQNTGVMITGLMLLKICDPDYSSPVLGDYSMGMALYSICALVITPPFYAMAGRSTALNFLFNVAVSVFFLGIAAVGSFMLKNATNGNELHPVEKTKK